MAVSTVGRTAAMDGLTADRCIEEAQRLLARPGDVGMVANRAMMAATLLSLARAKRAAGKS